MNDVEFVLHLHISEAQLKNVVKVEMESYAILVESQLGHE